MLAQNLRTTLRDLAHTIIFCIAYAENEYVASHIFQTHKSFSIKTIYKQNAGLCHIVWSHLSFAISGAEQYIYLVAA